MRDLISSIRGGVVQRFPKRVSRPHTWSTFTYHVATVSPLSPAQPVWKLLVVVSTFQSRIMLDDPLSRRGYVAEGSTRLSASCAAV